MIEFSLTEIVLFCWAVIATGYAFKCKQHAHMSDFVLRKVIEDKRIRDELVNQYEKAMSE
jgi:hypothetical protein